MIGAKLSLFMYQFLYAYLAFYFVFSWFYVSFCVLLSLRMKMEEMSLNRAKMGKNQAKQ